MYDMNDDHHHAHHHNQFSQFSYRGNAGVRDAVKPSHTHIHTHMRVRVCLCVWGGYTEVVGGTPTAATDADTHIHRVAAVLFVARTADVAW
jgi:hypothetical protein